MSGYEPVLHALSVEPRVARPGDTVRLVFRTRNLGGLPSPAAAVRFVLPTGLERSGESGGESESDGRLEPGVDVVAVEPVEPGADVVASFSARVAAGLDDRSELVVRAVFELPSGALGTNACTVIVRSRPRFDGPASGVAVLALDGEIVRVRATVVNEGDGPARGLRIVVPVPAGCVALEGEAATRLERARLEVGERVAVSYDARIVAPVEIVRAEAYAQAEEMRCALPAREAVAPGPVLAAPRVALVPGRRRADVAIEVRNDGWADARDVAVRVVLPRPLRVLDGSLVVDGVPVDEDGPNGFARVFQPDGAGLALAVARVPGRGSSRVAFALRVPPGCESDVLEVVLGDHAACVPVSAAAVRDVRLRVGRAPVVAEPGARVELVAELANAGDCSETVIVSASGGDFVGDAVAADAVVGGAGAERASAGPIVLAPGAVVEVPLVVHVRDNVADDARLALRVSASDADGERARTELVLTARDRPWLALGELPVREGERVAYVLHNAGSTTARAVVARVGDEVHQLGPIAPGARASFAAGERAARRGGTVIVGGRDELALPTLDERPPAEVHAVLDAPASAVAGAPFAVRAEIVVMTAVDALAVRVPAPIGAVYVAGSTTLDGRALLDRGSGSPLAGEGLLLHGVPAGARVTLAWSLLADPAHPEGALELGGELVADGDGREIAPVVVATRPREGCAARPAGLAYHVDACTLAPDGTLVPEPAFPISAGAREPAASAHELAQRATLGEGRFAVAAMLPEASDRLEPFVGAPGADDVAPAPVRDADAFAFALRLDERRLAEIGRWLRGAHGDGLVVHLLALRALFPERETSDDVLVASALGAVHDALRDVFDRLFVKLRIPGFDVAASDLEDPALRRALVRLFERLLVARPGGATLDESVGEPASGRLAFERVREVLASFADAPFGAPAALRALVALLPTRCDGEPPLAAALADYARALDGVLARCASMPLREFDDLLAQRGERAPGDGVLGARALDDARAGLLAALDARAVRPGAPR
ncbi:MAG: hypothetical protein QOI11_267 [Candidatus Eremiobacteraeota bacterium]|nr:hypothetical protein [Candidatus Eremiobacteraeota bacterium]